MTKTSVSNIDVWKFEVKKTHTERVSDLLAIEEPLEIKLLYYNNLEMTEQSIAVTMRTPPHDFELVLGFLLTEGIIKNFSDVKKIRYCNANGKQDTKDNIVKVELQAEVNVELARLQRNFYTTSSCGICGKSSIENIQQTLCYELPPQVPIFHAKTILGLSQKIKNAQTNFKYTGGVHASALFDEKGELIMIREDVGRHNALDKVIGAMLAREELPLSDYLLWVSGRISFELVQKALMAGIACLVAVGAPSSLAVDMARASGMTLVGFTKEDRFNIYSGQERITF
ncbi:formate dehydrogenase accessory sulfurtransferase FdhD [Thermoflexibacter ruber]|uniref:Sulfur carrier protein FdhD n=1 Tax=Thermoflexibacter ruber TaxID=1003 RepID=A0A1I2HLW8_9BACT|nr:formate dehydrogenase accessory sulfurtransferase FdhD [Thermoflexibacter ruber]SFF31124.1 FdhD protein [Thermoflexibacter ruber]